VTLPHFPTGPELRPPEDFATPEGIPAEPPKLDDYPDLEKVLDAADRDGILDIPAEDSDAALEGRANLVRESVIAERLWLLGYLENRKDLASSSRITERRSFLNAVASFQNGAGLTIDKWSGEQTWRALQQLVTFESHTNVALYCVDRIPRPALVRAARLRLWSLGLLPRKPTIKATSDSLPDDALQKFWVLCGRFKLKNFGKPQPSAPKLIEQLFDQDDLLKAVAAASKKQPVGGGREQWVFAYNKRTTEKRRVTDPQVESFLACLAKIELWLVGFDVDITHSRNYPVYLFQGRVTQSNKKVKKALAQFWQQIEVDESTTLEGLSRRERRRRRKDKARLTDFITPELFKVLAQPEQATRLANPDGKGVDLKPPAADDYSIEIASRLQTQEEIENTWSKGKSLGMKLWDGMRRLWRWIRHGIRKILGVGRNIVRAFFRYSMKTFEIARLTIKTVASSMSQYVKQEIRTHSEIKLRLDRDGDIYTNIPAGASTEQMAQAGRRLRYFGAAFELSCKIISTIVEVIKSVAIAAIGWARLLWLLVRSYREIRPLYKQLKTLPKPAEA